MRDPGFGRTQRVLLLRRRRPSGDAHRPQREHGAYPVTTWTAACTIRPTGRQVSVAVFESTGGGDGAEGTNRAEVSGGTRDVWKQRFVQLNRYDGENLRYETEENGKVIRFLFDRGELAEERREDAQIRYIRGYDPLLLIQNGEEQSRFSFVQDEAGSTLFLLDEAHEIRKSYRYDAFGDILQETGDIPNRLTYTGQIYDGVAGQYYLRARFYNPVVGRFLQEDVYRGDGLNLYAYCANNPVMYYDPSGQWKLCPNGKLEPTNSDFDKVRNYRNKDISNIDPRFLADPEYIVDMPYVGEGMKGTNSQGWKRNAKYFFTELSRTHPELFSSANMRRISRGKIPKVDEQFLKYFPQYNDYMGEVLRHHHIGGGGQAMPVPDSLHLGSGGIHNVEKLNEIWGGADAINAKMLQGIKSITRQTRLWKNLRIK